MTTYWPTVILANGAFPTEEIPLRHLQNAERIIVCDGATENLQSVGLVPDNIVGDLDSLSPELKDRYRDRLYHDPDQETNDLTKAVRFALKNGWNRLVILGATGKREDHSLGNISLLADYGKTAEVCMLTDHGIFVPIDRPTDFESFPTQQVSLFCLDPRTLVGTSRLKYPLNKACLTSWWQGTLNECLDDSFEIDVENGSVIVFRSYTGK